MTYQFSPTISKLISDGNVNGNVSLNAGLATGVNVQSSGSDITLTNAMVNTQRITFTSTGRKLILPVMNATNSLPIGSTISITNTGTNSFAIYATDTTTVIVGNITTQETVYLILTTNSSNGSFNIIREKQSVTPYDYGAVGDGVTNDNTAIQNWINSGKTLVCTRGTFICTTQKTFNTNNQKFIGEGGELRFTAGIDRNAALLILGNNVNFSGLWLTNPNLLGSPNLSSLGPYGDNSTGVYFHANYGTVVNSLIDSFMTGIAVSAGAFSSPEKTKFNFHNNFIKDVIGAGEGSLTNGTGLGEDRGDGITIWGSVASVTGNVVTAMEGKDARIGIHFESLFDQSTLGDKYDDMVSTFTGNSVIGPFRRGLAFEDISNALISSNSVMSSTWHGLSTIRSKNTIITGNTVWYDRDPNDLTGGSWDPDFCGIMIYGDVIGASVTNNNIYVTGSCDAAILANGLADTVDRGQSLKISNNVINAGDLCLVGIKAQYHDDIDISDNVINGAYNRGIYLYDTTGHTVKHNKINGIIGYQQKVVLASITGTFTIGATVTGSVSGASGKLLYVNTTDRILTIQFTDTTPRFTTSDTLSGGGGSGAVTSTNRTSIGIWDEANAIGGEFVGNRFKNLNKAFQIANKSGTVYTNNSFDNVNVAFDNFGDSNTRYVKSTFNNVTTKYAYGFGAGDYIEEYINSIEQVNTVSANTTLDSRYGLVLVDCSGGNRTITLPTAASSPNFNYVIKKIDSSGNSLTVVVSGGGNIDGSASLVTTTQYATFKVKASATNWYNLS